ncbi:TonB family protein [Granulicella mallensis]|uniref:TonB family protein n=1 Tax=Granulicella mallensis TaxID=940614 RepID=A0A7W7ZTQ2_9BACT|nr:M56 family metallopeptidase [Granulicella mallensis]MBB5065905.1 TonB family protein [Granulicella mallensis]
MSSLRVFMASYVVNAIWEVALIAAAGWMVSRLLKRLGPQAEHVTRVSTLALAILMPGLPFFRWLMAFLHAPDKGIGNSSITLVAAQGDAAHVGGIYVLPAILILPLLLLYAGSLFYFAVRLVWSLQGTARLLQQASPISLSPEQEEIWRDCKRSFSVEAARILSSSRVSGPVTLGFREPVLLVPVGFAEGCTPQDFLAALAHECAHIRRRDFQKNIFYEVASLLLVFHPVLWMLKSHIAQTREMVCDGMATERLIDSRSYTQSLLRLATRIAMASRVSTLHAIGIFDANILEKRVMMMNIKKQPLSSVLKYGLILPSTLFLLSIAAGGAAMAVVIEPQSPSQAQPYGQIYHVGKDKDVSAPVVIFSKDPEFPKSARGKKGKFNGTCVVRLIVDSTGTVHDVRVRDSLSPDFDASAIEAVQQYRFKPAMRSGEPVAVDLIIAVNFARF